jgi:trimeric autotransporter adhesin
VSRNIRGLCSFRLLILTAFIMILSIPFGYSQVTSGTILGTVTDPKGAVVAGAKVVITNTATSVKSTTTTNPDGNYEVPYLISGPYQVTVDAPGFETFQLTNIILNIDQNYRADAVLKVGSETQAVVVTSNAYVLQTDSSQLIQTINESTIEAVPNVNNNPLFYATLVAGVTPTGAMLDPQNVNVGDSSRGYLSGFTVNGSMPLTSNIQLDGAMDTSPFANEIIVLPSIDSMGQATVITNAYSAEYGRAAGGVMNLTTKSGTDTYHGTLYEDFRNTVMNANSYGNNYFTPARVRPPFDTNLFGATAGGPVWIPKLYNGHGKFFVFSSYQGLRRKQGASTYYTVPTARERTGDFSQTKTLVSVSGVSTPYPVSIYLPLPSTTTVTFPAAGQYQVNRQQAVYNGVSNVIPPQYLDATAKTLMNYWPLPNITPVLADGTENYFTEVPTYTQTDQLLDRFDYNVNAAQKAFVRFSVDWTLSAAGNIYASTYPQASNNGVESQFVPSMTVGYDWVITPKSTLEVRAAATRLNLVLGPCCGGSNYNLAGMGFASDELTAVPNQVFPEINTVGAYPSMGLGAFALRNNHTTVYSFTPNYTRLLNRLTLKTGMEYDAIFYNFDQPQYPSFAMTPEAATWGAACNGTGCAAVAASNPQGWTPELFMLGANRGSYASGEYSTNEPSVAVKSGYWALYSQNDWNVTRNLTLNLGARWEYQGPITERHNWLSQFNLTALNPTGTPGAYEFAGVNGDPRTQLNNDWLDFAPRTGFAYRFDKISVLRGAYGISFIPTTGVGSGSQGFGVDGFARPDFGTQTPSTGPDAGLPILQNVWTSPNFFTGGGVTAGDNPNNHSLLGNSVTAFIRTQNRTPYMQQWNLAVQTEFPAGIDFQLAYVGTKGTRLPQTQYPIDQTDQISPSIIQSALSTYQATGANPLTALVPNPFYGIIPNGTTLTNTTITQSLLDLPYPAYSAVTRYDDRSDSSAYNAMQVTVRRSFQQGFQILGTYTWSKTFDYGENYAGAIQGGASNGTPFYAPGNRRLDRSVSDFFQPNRATLVYLWALPFGKGQKFLAHTPVLSQIVGGWNVAGVTTFASGFPVPLTGVSFGRADVIADPRLPKSDRVVGPATVVLPTGQNYTVAAGYKLYFNPDAFSGSVLTVPKVGGTGTVNVANPYHFGNAPRMFGNLLTPGINNTDLNVTRVFAITERLHLLGRLDAYNAFNRVELGSPGGGFGGPNLTTAGSIGMNTSSTFGLINVQTAQTAVSQVTNSPRFLQASLKLTF